MATPSLDSFNEFFNSPADTREELLSEIVAQIKWDDHVQFSGNPSADGVWAELYGFDVDAELRTLNANVHASWSEQHSGGRAQRLLLGRLSRLSLA